MSYVNPSEKPIPVADRIHAWLTYDGDPRRPSAPQLSERDEEVWGRWQTILSKVLKTGVTWSDASTEICKTFEISTSTYYRDVRGISKIFPQLVVVSREMKKAQLYEMAMEAWRMAKEKQDIRGMNAAHKNLMVLEGFDRDEPDRIDPEKLNPGIIALVMDDASRTAFQKMAASGSVINLTPNSEETIDIPHEEVKDGEEPR